MSEHKIVSRLDPIFKTRVIHSTLIVISQTADIDVDKLETLLYMRNFPLGINMFIEFETDLYLTWVPDVILVYGEKLETFERVLCSIGTYNGLLVFV